MQQHEERKIILQPCDYYARCSLSQNITSGRELTPQGGTADHTRETYLEGRGKRGNGRGKEGAHSIRGKGGGERYNRVEHPSHAVAAQPHFATSILPARLHSHSVDPFTEGMSHMPPSPPLPSPFPPPFPLRRILSSPSNPRTLLSAACTPPAITVSVSYAVSLSILSCRPSLSSTRARQRLPSRPPIPLSPRHYLSFFLSRSLVYSTKVSLFLSISVV